jgi:hypothetical protein
MAGETQYINPIIQSMFETARIGQVVAQRKQESEQFAAEQALREKTAATTQKHLEGQTEYQKELIQQNAERLKQEHDLNFAHIFQLINEATARGGDISKMGFPAGQPIHDPNLPNMGVAPDTTQTIKIPGLGDVNPAAFSNPASNIANEAARVRAVTSAKAGAEDPFITKYKDIDALNRTNAQHQELLNALELEKARGGDAQRLEKIRAGAEYARTKLTGDYHVKGIEIANGIDPDDPSGTNNVNENLIDGILQGQESYPSLPKIRKQGVDALAASRKWILPTDQKKYAKDLDAVSTIQQVVSQFRDLANNYSIDSSKGGLGQIMKHGQIPGVVPVSDLNSKLDTMKGSGGTLASYFDQQNRKSDAEIMREVQSAFDPRATSIQNNQKLNDLTKRLDVTVKNSFRGMPSDEVNHILSSHGVTDFGGYGVGATPQTGKTINIVRDPATGQLVQQ